LNTVLRISVREESDAENVVLVLEGRVIGPWVEELRATCAPHLKDRRSLILDLAGVSFADAEGIELLAGLIERQITVTNPSPFLRQQLQPNGSISLPGRGTR